MHRLLPIVSLALPFSVGCALDDEPRLDVPAFDLVDANRTQGRDVSMQILHSVAGWLHGHHGDEALLARVVGHGDAAIPLLVSTLRSGLSPATAAWYRREFNSDYDGLLTYAKSVKQEPAMERKPFVDREIAAVTRQFKKRAAEGLAAMRTEKARTALREAGAKAEPELAAFIKGLLEPR